MLALAGVGTGDAAFPFLPMISGRQIRGVIEGDSDTRTFIPELARGRERERRRDQARAAVLGGTRVAGTILCA